MKDERRRFSCVRVYLCTCVRLAIAEGKENNKWADELEEKEIFHHPQVERGEKKREGGVEAEALWFVEGAQGEVERGEEKIEDDEEVAVEIRTPLLVETGIEEKDEGRDERNRVAPFPDALDDGEEKNACEGAQKQREDLPIERDVRQDARGDLIKHSPHGTVAGEVTRHRLGPEFVGNPRHGQVVPVEAEGWN